MLAARVLLKVSPVIASVKHDFNSLYCKFAIATGMNRKNIVDLPIADPDMSEGIFTDIQSITVSHIDPELYYYFTRFSSIYSDNFRETLESWGYTVKSNYYIVDDEGKVLVLVTTDEELYCYDVFGRIISQ